MTQPASKQELRRRLLDARRSQSPATRSTENAGLRTHVATFLHKRGAHRVAAYMPVDTEPGGIDFALFLHALGFEVIIPVSNPDFSMSWVEYSENLAFRPGAFGIAEPDGPLLPGHPLDSVDIIIVPALAADRDGYRLGKGGGYYDRALATLAAPVTVSLLFSHELLDSVPHEPHDAPMSAIITPQEIFCVTEPFQGARQSN
ncbi:5-formyltetrahydrofolate cyclo-ligase [Corynebacterium kalinowskii]|nr:5-formyltetrahydrofolate cyclo-ligase [Corynebacterium kalinowskii]